MLVIVLMLVLDWIDYDYEHEHEMRESGVHLFQVQRSMFAA